jgi:hypothetical protein
MPSRRRDPLHLPLLAGWLFADLMVVLFLIGLGFVSTDTVSKPTPGPTSPAVGPSSQPATPTASPTRRQRVLLPQHYTVTVSFPVSELLSGDPGAAPDGQLATATDQALDTLAAKQPELAGKLVAVAVIFGIGPQTGSGIGNAITEATEAGVVLHANDARFRQASFLDYWSGAASSENSLEMVIFFYAS